jgi:hypothetical protein
MRAVRIAGKLLVGNSEGKKLLMRPTHRWENCTEQGVRMWTGFIWLRMWSGGELV